MPNLWTLYRRRRLAYELLDEYDLEPLDFKAALSAIKVFAAQRDYVDRLPAWREDDPATSRWREAVERAKGRYPDA